MSKPGFVLPLIPAHEMTPTVKLLLAIIEQQQVTINRLEQRVGQLETEVARLKLCPRDPRSSPAPWKKVLMMTNPRQEPDAPRKEANARDRRNVENASISITRGLFHPTIYPRGRVCWGTRTT